MSYIVSFETIKGFLDEVLEEAYAISPRTIRGSCDVLTTGPQSKTAVMLTAIVNGHLCVAEESFEHERANKVLSEAIIRIESSDLRFREGRYISMREGVVLRRPRNWQPRLRSMMSLKGEGGVHTRPRSHISNRAKAIRRKTFDEQGLQDLAASIRIRGVLVPILVRKAPMPRGLVSGGMQRFELVAGERRWRAAKLAGKSTIPAVVRELTDTQVLEIQIVENLQREDLDPVEEAEGFQALVDQHGFTIDEVAAKTGKSKAVIYGALKILNLGKEAVKALREGKLSRSVAELLGRIPTEKDRKGATKYALGNDYQTPSVRQVKALIEDRYMVELKGASFDREDKNLVPEQGACSSCPFRTGNMHGLYPGRADVCTKPECFQLKRTRTSEMELNKAKAAGKRTLTPAETKRVFQHGDRPSYDGPFRSVDDTIWMEKGSKTVRALLNGHADQIVISISPSGELMELAPGPWSISSPAQKRRRRGTAAPPTKKNGSRKRSTASWPT